MHSRGISFKYLRNRESGSVFYLALTECYCAYFMHIICCVPGKFSWRVAICSRITQPTIQESIQSYLMMKPWKKMMNMHTLLTWSWIRCLLFRKELKDVKHRNKNKNMLQPLLIPLIRSILLSFSFWSHFLFLFLLEIRCVGVSRKLAEGLSSGALSNICKNW